MHRVVGLGEILWDVFPDGARFGGAPANFACNAAKLGRGMARVSVVSAVGRDSLGEQALAALQSHGVDTSSVQVNAWETGTVHVELDDAGVATYRFAEDTSWDHLAWSQDLEESASSCDAVCFGTLGQRAEPSRETIRRFVTATPPTSLRILDINLRRPYFDDSLLLDSLELANVLKLNDDELVLLAEICGLQGSLAELLPQFAERFGLHVVAVTRGGEGAAIYAGGQLSDLPGEPVEVVDTVGAGDAYTASMTLGLLEGNDLDGVNQEAIATAAAVCGRAGAT